MKKLLLLTVVAIMGFGKVAAVNDGNPYEPVNDIKIKNLWIYDRKHTSDAYTQDAVCNTRARTAVMSDGIVYVARSEEKLVLNGTDTIGSQAIIHRFNAADGSPMEDLEVTLDGAPYVAFLGVNSIGVDNFGHLWVAPYTSEKAEAVPFYALDKETGELTSLGTLVKGDAIARTDYYDVVGDIFREEAECNIISTSANEAIVYYWHCDQDCTTEDDWEGGFDGDTYLEILEFYPESLTNWGYGPFARFCLGEDEDTRYAGEIFYIDGFHSIPILYDNTGTIIDSFENVPIELHPETGTNGVAEFVLDGRNFIVYSNSQYTPYNEELLYNYACQTNICELGEGMSLGDMQLYWRIPKEGLGELSDGGNRIHCYNVEYATEDGEEVIYLFNFKCYNGMGVYKIGKKIGDDPEPLIGDCNGDGEIDVKDVSMLIAYILGDSPEGFIKENANINQDPDGEIDVQDVTALINLILS